jgi:hypothetical protein
VALGPDPIWPGLLSIVPACVQPWLVFEILRKLGVARAVRLVIVLAFAGSYSFTFLGILVRSYSLATLATLVSLWAALDMIPGPGRPDRPGGTGSAIRRSAVLALVSSTVAVWCLYPAGFTTAVVVVAVAASALISRRAADFVRPWREHARWPEWSRFLGGHLACVGWVLLTYGGRELPHVKSWFPGPEEGAISFVLAGLRNILESFSPLPLHSGRLTDLALALGGAVLIVLVLRNSGREGVRVARRGALLALPLYLVVLVLLALARKYPFGGEARHMYVLYPFLFCALALLTDELARLHRGLKVAACTTILAGAAWASWVGHSTNAFGETPHEPLFSQDLPYVLNEEHAELPIYFCLFAFQGPDADLRRVGWRMLEHVEDLDVLRLGGRWTVYRDRLVWQVPELGDERVSQRLELVCRESGAREVVVFAPLHVGATYSATRGELNEAWGDLGWTVVEARQRPDAMVLRLRR